MMRFASASPQPAARDQPQLPAPQALAALGTLLCLSQGGSGGELAGWSRAVRAEACASVDSDGMRECVAFRDANGTCCWKLYLLPDSDFLAWERLSLTLPAHGRDDARDEADRAGIADRLLQRLAGRARHGEWQASVLRLHALRGGDGRTVLAATLASISPLGAAAARAIARSQGAAADALRDDCCCARAAQEAARASAQWRDDPPYPLVRLQRPGSE